MEEWKSAIVGIVSGVLSALGTFIPIWWKIRAASLNLRKRHGKVDAEWVLEKTAEQLEGVQQRVRELQEELAGIRLQLERTREDLLKEKLENVALKEQKKALERENQSLAEQRTMLEQDRAKLIARLEGQNGGGL